MASSPDDSEDSQPRTPDSAKSLAYQSSHSSLDEASVGCPEQPKPFISLRWRPVVEAPDSNPRPRGQARPRRGRPRKLPPAASDRGKERREAKLNIIRWIPPTTPLYNQPPAGTDFLPWASEWPEILQYYMSNSSTLNPSCNLLYSPKRYLATTGAFYDNFQTSAGTLTLRILFAEASRVDRRTPLEKLLWLKGQALNLINERLRDPRRQLSAETLSDIVTLHNYEQLFGTREVARMHRKGLLQLITLFGGIGNLPADARLLSTVILWTDRARQGRRLHEPDEDPPEYPLDIEPGLQPLHPINIALLPPPGKSATSQVAGHALGISLLGPGVPLMVALEGLQRVVGGVAAVARNSNGHAHTPPAADAASAAALRMLGGKADQIWSALRGMRRNADDPDESVFFTDPAFAAQQEIFDACRMAGLLVVQLLYSELLDRGPASLAARDALAEQCASVDLVPLLEHYPGILLWLVFMIGPWQLGQRRGELAELGSRACDRISLSTWCSVRDKLTSIYYYPGVQGEACERFYRQDVCAIRADEYIALKTEDLPIKIEDVSEYNLARSWSLHYNVST